MDSEANLPFEHFPLVDAIDHEILMHRDAHFGGQFSIMLDYYRQEGKGVQPEFDIMRIERLALLEEQLKQNLAVLFLAAHEIQKVADSHEAYQRLRAIYEVKQPKTPYPRLIADLILSEEEEPEAEIAAITAEKDKIVPALIDLLRSEELYDPLFPGYGQAPFLAVQCLGRIGDKRAIISLFEALGQGDFFADDQIVKALKAIGKPAQDFLLHVLNGRPLNEDNEKAAIALIAFKDDEEVAEHCFDLLQKSDIQKDPCLPTYLVLACAGMKDPVKRRAFKNMAHDSHLPSLLREDIKGIMHDWEQNQESS
jgi:HEAT repeat protein